MPLEDRFWTPSKLKSYATCPHRYYLEENVGFNRVAISVRPAASRFFSQNRKEVYRVRDGRRMHVPQIPRRAGKFLKDVEEMNPEELREFIPAESPESFGKNLAFNRFRYSFNRIIDSEKFAGKDLVASSAGQPGQLTMMLAKAFEEYAEFAINNGAPLISLLDFRTYFDVGGTKLNLVLPELRPRVIDGKYYIFVDRPSFANFSTGNLSEGVEDSPLVTLDLMAVTHLITNYELPQWQLGMPDAFVDLLQNEKPDIAPRLVYRSLVFGGKKSGITTLRRTQEDAEKTKDLVSKIVEQVKNREFEPNTDNCNSCYLSSLGMNNRPHCNESHATSSTQSAIAFFNAKRYQYEINDVDEGFEVICKAQAFFDGRKELVEMARNTISIDKTEGIPIIEMDYEPTLYDISGTSQHYNLPFTRIYRVVRKEIKERVKGKVLMLSEVPELKDSQDFMAKRGFEENLEGRLEKSFA